MLAGARRAPRRPAAEGGEGAQAGAPPERAWRLREYHRPSPANGARTRPRTRRIADDEVEQRALLDADLSRRPRRKPRESRIGHRSFDRTGLINVARDLDL